MLDGACGPGLLVLEQLRLLLLIFGIADGTRLFGVLEINQLLAERCILRPVGCATAKLYGETPGEQRCGGKADQR